MFFNHFSFVNSILKLKEIAINKIYYSIQGEGFHTGTPAIFIRIAGCNLSCSYCDTDFSLRESLTYESILERIARFPAELVILTGGEPTIQAEALRELVTLLHRNKYYVALETNGTSPDTMGVDWVTVSPKLTQGGEWGLRHGDELKLIYEEQNLSVFEKSGFTHYYLQPMEIRTEKWGRGERDVKKTRNQLEITIDAVKKNPKWKLSFQIHKELGIP